MTKAPWVKLKLPVGALMGGMIHLGGGEFAMPALPVDELGCRLTPVREGVAFSDAERDAWPASIASEECAAPDATDSEGPIYRLVTMVLPPGTRS